MLISTERGNTRLHISGLTTRTALFRWACLASLLATILLFDPIHGTFDTRFSYSVSDVADYLAILGDKGRRHYLWHELLDVVFVLAYSATIVGTANRLYRSTLPVWVLPLCLLPGVIDMVENLCTIGLIISHPATSLPVARLLHVATPAKWIAVAFALLVLMAKWLDRKD